MFRKLILVLSLLPTMVMAQTKLPDVALDWLSLIDTQQYSESWDSAGYLFRAQVSKEEWVDAVGTARKAVGKLQSRQLATTKLMDSLPNVPNGKYAIIQYQSAFSGKQATETLTLTNNSTGWHVIGYYINLLNP